MGRMDTATRAPKRRLPFALPRIMARKRFWIPAALVLAAAAWFFVFGGGGNAPVFETAAVERGSVTRIVSETGVVEAADAVELAFTTSGRIESVLVREGDRVARGATLVALDAAHERAALRAAEAQARSAGSALGQTRSAQDQAVESAHVALVSGDLQAYLAAGAFVTEGTGWSYEQPRITGTYACKEEGEYRLMLYRSAAPSGYSFRVSGIEDLVTGTVSVSQPQPLGACGLFIQFPEGFARGSSVEWVIPIPNTRSATYASRRAGYEAALEARDLALVNAETTDVAAAAVDQARAALAATVLYAPFEGLVTDVAATRGQIASPGAPMVSLISADRFEISVAIPEDDIEGIAPGDRALVTFEAYDGVTLEAEVAYVAPAAAVSATGATTFKVLLRFLEEDARLRAGLSADVDIIVDRKDEVIAVASRAVIEEDGVRYARVMEGETAFRKVPVKTGLRGEGQTEIVGGLSGGERIITFVSRDVLAALTDLGFAEPPPEDASEE